MDEDLLLTLRPAALELEQVGGDLPHRLCRQLYREVAVRLRHRPP